MAPPGRGRRLAEALSSPRRGAVIAPAGRDVLSSVFASGKSGRGRSSRGAAGGEGSVSGKLRVYRSLAQTEAEPSEHTSSRIPRSGGTALQGLRGCCFLSHRKKNLLTLAVSIFDSLRYCFGLDDAVYWAGDLAAVARMS